MPGRNDRCPCGSGLKYKKCCQYGRRRALGGQRVQEFAQRFLRQAEEEQARQRVFGQTRPIIYADFRGKRLVAVGGRLLSAPIERWRTVLDFLFDYLADVLGREWLQAEARKLQGERHTIAQWRLATIEIQKQHSKGNGQVYSLVPNGACAAYYHLAYDLYVLHHHVSLQRGIVDRLRQADQFQGARYELFAAATCIRAGFDVTYEDETDGSKKHPEFTATHRSTGQRIAVEAKSRHLPGILGRAGTRAQDEEIRAKAGHLLRKALKKQTTLPFVVFIDLNVPPSRVREIRESFPNSVVALTEDADTPESPYHPYNLILLTNHPHHYGRPDEPDPSTSVFAVWSERPGAIPDHPQAIIGLFEAAQKYGNIPNWFPRNAV